MTILIITEIHSDVRGHEIEATSAWYKKGAEYWEDDKVNLSTTFVKYTNRGKHVGPSEY
jgi:hypothetical protein